MWVAEKLDWKGLKVKDQEKRREEENRNVGRSDIGSKRVNYALLNVTSH
jgi:hypothetical protein